MTPDAFDVERHRIEQTLNLLERSSDRLVAGDPVAMSELSEAVAFLRAIEKAGYDDAQKAGGNPVLTSCVEEHVAARAPLARMETALSALAAGDQSAAAAFAESARSYIRLWREHVRADDRVVSAHDR